MRRGPARVLVASVLLTVVLFPGSIEAQGRSPAIDSQRLPVIDMHLHAMGANDQGPAPIPVCAPFQRFPVWDARAPYYTVFMSPPPCEEPIWSPETDEELRNKTIAAVRELNVFGVLSGSMERVHEWTTIEPDRFIKGFGFRLDATAPPVDSLRAMVEDERLEVLAEVTNQYNGIAPDDARMAPYWALAEEMDLPVGIHMGPGPPGGNYLGEDRYRARLSSALLLEDVVVRHPRLRVYVMHAGYPLLDDMMALLYAHPQVYVEVGVIVYSRPRADFYRYLEALIDAGFEERIMFGSDQMNWPETIGVSIDAILEAPFLSDTQKRAILYDNAARFLRLTDEEQAEQLAAGRR
jgi:uncharacterized protein